MLRENFAINLQVRGSKDSIVRYPSMHFNAGEGRRVVFTDISSLLSPGTSLAKLAQVDCPQLMLFSLSMKASALRLWV